MEGLPYIFHDPVRKKDAFVARVQRRNGSGSGSTKGGNFILKATECKLASIRVLKDGGGCLLKVWLPPGCHAEEEVTSMDQTALDAIRVNNGTWFRNNLSEEKMIEYFRPALAEGQPFTVLVSDMREPDPPGEWDTLKRMDARSLRSVMVNCIFEAQGLFFYPKRFGIRWMLRGIRIQRDEEEEDIVGEGACRENNGDGQDIFHGKGGPLLSEADCRGIEESWESEVDAFSAKVDAKILELEEKKREVQGWLQAAKDAPQFGREWNEALEKLCGAMMRDKEFFI